MPICSLSESVFYKEAAFSNKDASINEMFQVKAWCNVSKSQKRIKDTYSGLFFSENIFSRLNFYFLADL